MKVVGSTPLFGSIYFHEHRGLATLNPFLMFAYLCNWWGRRYSSID